MDKPVKMHVSTHCDVGLMRCGVKLTDKNRRSLDGFQVCDTCFKVAKQPQHKSGRMV